MTPATPAPWSAPPTRWAPTRSCWPATRSTPTTPRPSGPASAASSTCRSPSSPIPVHAVRAAQDGGLVVLAADGDGELALGDAAEVLAGPTAWLFGNEAWGLPAELAAAGRPPGADPDPRTGREPQPGDRRRDLPPRERADALSGALSRAVATPLRVVVLVPQPAEQGEDLPEDRLADDHVLQDALAVLGRVDEGELGAAQLVGEVCVVAEDLGVDGEQLRADQLDQLGQTEAGGGVRPDAGPATPAMIAFTLGSGRLLGAVHRQRRAERVGDLAEHLVHGSRVVLDGVDDHLQGRHGGAAHLSQRPQDRAAGGRGPRRTPRGAARSRHRGGADPRGGSTSRSPPARRRARRARTPASSTLDSVDPWQNPRKLCEISCGSEDSATILLLVRVPERRTPGGSHGGGAAHHTLRAGPTGGRGRPAQRVSSD